MNSYPDSPQGPMAGPPPGGPPRPARRGIPWWGWLLGGCGCLMILAIGGIGLAGFGLYRLGKSVAGSVGPIDRPSLQKSMGSDAPLYPKGTVDELTTRSMIGSMRAIEKLSGKGAGGVFKGIVALNTSDTPEQVNKYYDRQLVPYRWQRVRREKPGTNVQTTYQKGNDFLMIQCTSTAGGSTMVMMMRGGPELMKQAPAQ
jgi:hypothetical protein